MNASVEFDLNILKPTYKLLIGIPGKSNAFAISEKLGLDKNIIDRANTFINSDNVSIEDVLKSIYDDRQLIQKNKEETEKNLAQAEILKKSFERKSNSILEKETSIIENAKLEARNILQDAKIKVSNAIQEINSSFENINNSSIKNLNNTRNKLTEAIRETTCISNVNMDNPPSINKDDLYIGMPVLVNSLNQSGVVCSLVNKSNEICVQIGSVKMMVNLNSISKTDFKKIDKSKSSNLSYSTNKARNATTEINVIGYNIEEAIFVIDKYLDDCSLAKLSNIRIVHGKGTGKLREGIHNFLKKNLHVKSFRLGTFGEGETGVTIVEIK